MSTTTYKLTDTEKKAVASLEQQYKNTRAVLENAKQIVQQKEADLIALQGATSGMAVLIANQQGLVPTGKETVKFDESFDSLIITPPEESKATQTQSGQAAIATPETEISKLYQEKKKGR